MKHPPGRKVYQRGAHIIWEVDGAKDKVCRCLHPITWLGLIRLSVILPESIFIRKIIYRCQDFVL